MVKRHHSGDLEERVARQQASIVTLKPTELHPPGGRTLDEVLACERVIEQELDRELTRTIRTLTLASCCGLVVWLGAIALLLYRLGAL